MIFMITEATMQIKTTSQLAEHDLNDIFSIHQTVFGDIEHFKKKLAGKRGLVFTLSISNDKVVGYKIGYPLSEDRFYSWMGAVSPVARNKGVATSLMIAQHNWAKTQHYRVIETKTMNRWRQMLLLNIKHGFDVKAVEVERDGVEKIILEKRLD